jgi:hypothetical protein
VELSRPVELSRIAGRSLSLPAKYSYPCGSRCKGAGVCSSTGRLGGSFRTQQASVRIISVKGRRTSDGGQQRCRPGPSPFCPCTVSGASRLTFSRIFLSCGAWIVSGVLSRFALFSSLVLVLGRGCLYVHTHDKGCPRRTTKAGKPPVSILKRPWADGAVCHTPTGFGW